MVGERRTICKCSVCDTVVDILDMIGLEISCCGQAMLPLEAKQNCQEGSDTHLPTFEMNAEGLRIIVGEKRHAMHEDHRIEWIEVTSGSVCVRRFLEPGQDPEATFGVRLFDRKITARAYCNLHGLWECSVESRLPRLAAGAAGKDCADKNDGCYVETAKLPHSFSVKQVCAAV